MSQYSIINDYCIACLYVLFTLIFCNRQTQFVRKKLKLIQRNIKKIYKYYDNNGYWLLKFKD